MKTSPEGDARDAGAQRAKGVAPDPSRRRFGKLVLGTTPILLTLPGRPLWAGANCSVSGWVSGNTSMHHELTDCGGETPGYWQGPASKDHYGGWRQTHGERLDSIHGFPALSFTVAGEPCTLQQALERPMAIDGVGNDTRQTLRFGTAALLNARYGVSRALTEVQVVDMVTQAVLNGHYETPTGDWLSEAQVRRFIENTQSAPNWGP